MQEEINHFESVESLKSLLSTKMEYYEIETVETPVFKQEYFSVKDGFEAILNTNNQKVLIPEAIQYPFLFRGQKNDFPLIPTLYRNNPNPLDIFIERLRLAEFEILLNSHPVVEHFFRKHKFSIDSVGLAQHYGLKTEALDFTNDLDIAIFFAVCDYDAKTDSYKPYEGDEVRTGYIFFLNPSLFSNSLDSEELFGDKISVIGMQPFARPGQQKGFAYLTSMHDKINAVKYSFSYTKEDSLEYFERYGFGQNLWTDDILADKTRPIINKWSFSYKTFNHACYKYLPKGFSKTRLQKKLREQGVELSGQIENCLFSQKEITDIVRHWNSPENIRATISKIRRRRWHERIENTDKLVPEKLFRTAFIVKAGEHLRLIMNREGLEEQIEEQKRNPRHEFHGIPSHAKTKKVPGMLQCVRSEPFLTEKDCVIRFNYK